MKIMQKQTKNLVATALSLTLSMAGPLVVLAENAYNLPPLQPQLSSEASAVNPYQQNEAVSLRGRISTVPKGTMLMIKVDSPLSSGASRLGEQVTATLENDIFINDAIAVPAGSEVIGQVASVDPAGHLGQHGSIDVRFSSVKTPDGTLVPIQAHVVTTDQSGILKGDSYAKDVIKGVAIAAGGTGVGTLMGLSAGSLIGSAGAGALFGLGVGAIGGMGYALYRKGKEVVVPSGSRMSITLDHPVTVNL